MQYDIHDQSHLSKIRPSHKPMMTACQLEPWEQATMEIELNYQSFHSTKCIWKSYLQNGSQIIQATIY